MGLVSKMKTLGAVAQPNGKPSTNKLCVAKQKVKCDGDAKQ